jgi:hypothetical protein
MGFTLIAVSIMAVLGAMLPVGIAGAAVGGAGYTTFDATQGGCLDSPNGVNCNNYTSKDDVYMSGGPSAGGIKTAGDYFFAVLAPGSQHGGFIDGADGNLSSPNDTAANRTFSVGSDNNGNPVITGYAGNAPSETPHLTGTSLNGKFIIQLSPYDDTPNPGGVYILAICESGATSPSQCKFDAFRVPSSQSSSPVDLTILKNAEPSYTRTFGWTIDKTVDGKKTETINQTGSSRTLNYSVVVTKGAGADSGWQVDGTITVVNPNSDPVTALTITDAISASGNPDSNATCSVDAGGTVGSVASLDGGAFLTLPYSCSYSGAPASSSETNTATVTWDTSSAAGTSGTASFDVPVSFGAPTTVVHDCVNLSDTFASSNVSGSTCSSHTFDYTRTVSVPHGCVTVNNTAGFTAADDAAYSGSSSASATVCRVPPKTGALTMGFWQNKNGQAIIGSYSGTNCQALRTWLNGYSPFADLTATNCTGVKSYVSNVIKAANASGASMNKMLKAQMLATALDVYFSDATLGGNRIGAPGPIGAVAIDLTQVCHMIDSTSGTGSCSGSFENSSAAFGGASSLTVAQMLSYAASQSNAGGSVWYANVKATQELAKDAFDAINNGAAFSV